MVDHMMVRNMDCDRYMEERFGKPLFKKRFTKNGELTIPMERQRSLFRIEPLPASRR